MKILLGIFFILVLLEAKAHPLSDTLASRNQVLSSLLKLPAIQQALIEVRIFKGGGISNGGEVLILRNVGTAWEAFLYKYYYKMSKRRIENKLKKVEITPLLPQSSWTHFWSALQQNRLLSLPDDQLIEDKKRGPAEYNEIRKAVGYKKIMVNDGTGYDIELKVDGLFHYYSYRNPEIYLEHFPQVEELQNFSNILKLIRQELNISF